MPRHQKIYDPDETERRMPLIVRETQCPGMLRFLAALPYRQETPLIRGVLYQWFLHHLEQGTLDAAVQAALSGPGGLQAETRRPALRSPQPLGTPAFDIEALRSGAEVGAVFPPAEKGAATGPFSAAKTQPPARPTPVVPESHSITVPPVSVVPAAVPAKDSVVSAQGGAGESERIDPNEGDVLSDAERAALAQMGNMFG